MEIFVFIRPKLFLFVSFFTLHLSAATGKPPRIVTKLIHQYSVLSPHYNPNSTISDLARRAIESSVTRVSQLMENIESSTNADHIRATLTAGELANVFYVNISIGEPPIPQLVLMDTGSSLLWVRCHDCTRSQCPHTISPIFNPSKSSTYSILPCENNIYCDDYGKCDTAQNCVYHIFYLGMTSSDGYIATDKITLITSKDDIIVEIPNSTFGCAHKYNEPGVQANGILGLGPRISSLVTRLGSKFSYCIGNVSNPSYNHNLLILGDGAIIEGDSTPIEVHKGHYYVILEGISVGSTRLNLDGKAFNKRTRLGDRRVLIDSGSTLTYLSRDMYDPLKAEIENLIGYNLKRVTIDVKHQERLCYKGLLTRDLKGFPVVTFHFAGGADLVLDIESMFHSISQDVFCMAVGLSETTMLKDESLIGVIAQQYYNIAYDLSAMRLSFQMIECELLEE